jgi:uncharacterized protein (TIGR00661 family)
LKRVLITPLNWGLGHATRCMPIINELLGQGAEVVIATDGRAFHLLSKEYPKLTILELPPYDITYKSENMMRNIAPQLPKIIKAIAAEYKAIQKIVKDYQIDAIISDNRFGCHSSTAYSVFITHQLNIQIPNRLAQPQVNFLNKQFIQRFDECWIPDFENEKDSLSGKLSANIGLKNVKYLGALTRMKHFKASKKQDVLIVLSGPEPQRTILEQELTRQAQALPLKILLIKGKTEEQNEAETAGNLTIKNYMTAHELNTAILESEVVITRSGYSTIMDLAVLGKPAILIPTPGQTEQEYLAQRFEELGIYHLQSQNSMDLKQALTNVKHYKGYQLEANDRLSGVVFDFLRGKFF